MGPRERPRDGAAPRGWARPVRTAAGLLGDFLGGEDLRGTALREAAFRAAGFKAAVGGVRAPFVRAAAFFTAAGLRDRLAIALAD